MTFLMDLMTFLISKIAPLLETFSADSSSGTKALCDLTSASLDELQPPFLALYTLASWLTSSVH